MADLPTSKGSFVFEFQQAVPEVTIQYGSTVAVSFRQINYWNRDNDAF
jgi:hypothetical protein